MIPEIGSVCQGWIYSGRCSSLGEWLQMWLTIPLIMEESAIITEYCSLPFYPGDQFCGLSGIGIIFSLICVEYAVHCCFYNVLFFVSVCSWTLSVDLGMFSWQHLLIFWKYTGMSYPTYAAVLQDDYQAFHRPPGQQLSNNSNWTESLWHGTDMPWTLLLLIRHWQCIRISVTISQDG